jgi:hypothetical protein
MKRVSVSIFLTALLLCAAPAFCQQEGKPITVVTNQDGQFTMATGAKGTVTLDGKPVVAAVVTFVPSDRAKPSEAQLRWWATVDVPDDPTREMEFEITVENTGTKAAEDVEISLSFGGKLDPTGVTGGDAYATNGEVSFEKIPTILPNQTVRMKVLFKGTKEYLETIRMNVVRADANGRKIRLEIPKPLETVDIDPKIDPVRVPNIEKIVQEKSERIDSRRRSVKSRQ